MTLPYCYVVQKEAVEFYGKDFRGHPVGTGPFRMKSWSEGQRLILLKNEQYFESENGRSLPYLDAVQVSFMDNPVSAFIEFTQGRLDFINELDESFRDEIINPDGSVKDEFESKYQIQVLDQFNTEFLGILVDSTMEPVKDHPIRHKLVRKALCHSIDREKLVKYLLKGNGTPGTGGLVPPGMRGYDVQEIDGCAFDPQLSSRLLREAGFPGGIGIPPIRIHTSPNYMSAMEFVQKSFERIGISARIEVANGATVREMASNGEIQCWRASWIADYPDPENYLSLCYSPLAPPNGPNRMRYSNARYDSLYLNALSTTQDSLRLEIYQQMDNLIMEDVPVIPLYYDRIFRILQPNISGMQTNPMNFLYLKRVQKDSKPDQISAKDPSF